MQELTGRLAAVDPEAGNALRVIAYFDSLVDGHAGIESFVRGAAVLAGCPARLDDPDRRVHIRVEPDGRRRDLSTSPDSRWPSIVLAADSGGHAWLERIGPASSIDSMVLERLAAGARVVLDRTRGRVLPDDDASLEVLLDGSLPAGLRLRAARRLSVDVTARARVLATLPPDGRGAVRASIVPEEGTEPDRGAGPPVRIGIGPAVDVLDLPRSWTAARLALRFTAAGTPADPGPQVVRAEELGGLALLAGAVRPGAPTIPDVTVLRDRAAEAPWLLATLDAVATHSSLRSAAAALHVHHSTVQDRLLHAEALLGWPLSEPAGRLRLELALVLRRLQNSLDDGD